MNKDTPYCGVDKDKIKNASPRFDLNNISQFSYYINERERIRNFKDLNYPIDSWTNDPILKNYRFTNVHRYDDRESKWLIQYISDNNDLTLNFKILNSILFRAFNKSESFEILQGYLPFSKGIIHQDYQESVFDVFQECKKIVDNYSSTYNWFGSAYFQSGLKGAWKDLSDAKTSAGRMFDMISYCYSITIDDSILLCKDQKEVFNTIKSIPGFANFLAYQVFVDLTYIPEFLFTDKEFTVSGPGCNRGIELVTKYRDGLTDEEIIFWLRDNQDCLKVNTELSVMDLENCMCEISKFLGYQQNPKKRMRRYV